jgi:hypothetical protein
VSKTRWDRKRRVEEWKSDYVALGGGLDQSSSALSIKPGRVSQGLNWEERRGKQGYSTTPGYERFDGRSSPSRANYLILDFDAGTAAFAQGDAVSNAGGTATATVVSYEVTSGSIGGGDAAGTLILCSASGEWADNDEIRVGGVQRATANGASRQGSIGHEGHEAALTATRTYLRGLIQAVSGSGSILGVAVFGGVLYAVRNVADGTSATLWKATTGGWVSVATGLHPGGAWKFWVANFTGDPTRRYLFGVNGRSRMIRVASDGTLTKADPIYGTEATSTTNVAYGTGAKTFTVQTGKDFEVGQQVTVWDTANAANYMAGEVTAYNDATGQLDVDVDTETGSGSNAAWEVGLSDYSDKAFLLREHKNHMFWAYPSGQLQTSLLGNPMSIVGGTSALFGLGQEITGLASLRGEALAVFWRSGIKILRGSNSTDFDLGPYSDADEGGIGAIAGTVQDNGGNPLFLDSKGLTSLQATQAFGDFAPAVLSEYVQSFMDESIADMVGTRMAAATPQYRIYLSDGTVMRAAILSSQESIGPKQLSFMQGKYLHAPTCLCSGVMSDTDSARMFFGTSDGYVMEEDAGASFDGEAISYVLRLPFNHFKSAQFIKQFHKLELELEVSNPAVTMFFRQLFDYDDQTYNFGTGEVEASAGGGQFDVSAFNTFQFDRPTVARVEESIDGQGRNMALLLFFESDFLGPVTLQGVLTYFSQLGMQR